MKVEDIKPGNVIRWNGSYYLLTNRTSSSFRTAVNIETGGISYIYANANASPLGKVKIRRKQ